MPHTHTATRPKALEFSSLAELFAAYEQLFLRGNDFKCVLESSCGLQVHVFDRCFLHLVRLKLEVGGSVVDFFPDIQKEKPKIRAVTEGFQNYLVDVPRARLLPSALDTLLEPHLVFEYNEPQTAHLCFVKHYGDRPYPCTFVLVGRSESDDDCLLPVTCFPCKKNQAKSRVAKKAKKILWRIGDEPLTGP